MSPNTKKALHRSFAGVIGVGVGLIAAGSGLVRLVFPNPCTNTIRQVAVSPNGKLKAVQFHRDCGATTGFSTQVSNLRASRRLSNEGGNVFIVRDEPIVAIHWIDDRHLHISGGSAGAAFLRLTDFRGVQVTYD